MTTSIGYRWKCSDAWSRVVLITRMLPQIYSFYRKTSLTLFVCFVTLNLSRKNTAGPKKVRAPKIKVANSYKDLLVVIARGFTSSHSEQRS